MPHTRDGKGYWLVASDGGIFSFGDAAYYGSTGSIALNKPIVGMAATPDGRGYWLVAADGGIFSFGDAAYYGSTGSIALNKPIVGMTATPDGKGYWLVASDGGIFSFGDAAYYGSTGSIALNKPIVGMTATPDGKGYWLVASDGGIFSFGDAAYYGSTGSIALNKPIVGMTATPDGRGYWLVASDGGIFSFGDAAYDGSEPSTGVDVTDVVGVASNPDGDGYWIEGGDGRVSAFGDTIALGSMLGSALRAPVVGLASVPNPHIAPQSLEITSLSLPTALTGSAYATSLSASGGTTPYTWTIASGSLPPGLSLSPNGKITGTPSDAGSFTFTVRATDASSLTAQRASTVLSFQVSPSSPPLNQSGPLYESRNWSGYVAGDGPFTAAGGTFSVASLDASAAIGDYMAEWVGIDGGNGGGTVIQAGVQETPDPSNPHLTTYMPFWETYPAPPVLITDVGVSAGDEVTVNISQNSDIDWGITVTDDTNGESFTIDTPYTGPGSTAEWIVEAPGNGLTLAPYGPYINFSDLRISPINTAVEELEMLPKGDSVVVSTPSTLTSNGFNVAYGDAAPAPP